MNTNLTLIYTQRSAVYPPFLELTNKPDQKSLFTCSLTNNTNIWESKDIMKNARTFLAFHI